MNQEQTNERRTSDIEEIEKSQLFHVDYYLLTYAAKHNIGTRPLEHFLTKGGFEGLNPNPHFDCALYLRLYADAREEGINPLLHWLHKGKAEGRITNMTEYNVQLIWKSGLFDTEYYVKTYPEVKRLKLDPVVHYHTLGWKQGYNPSPSFNVNFYLQTYPAALSTGEDPLVYHITRGVFHGNSCNRRDHDYAIIKQSGFFDDSFYRTNYLDLPANTTDTLRHYISLGYREKKKPSRYFDVAFYERQCPEVVEQDIVPLVHYITKGRGNRMAMNEFESNLYMVEDSGYFDDTFYIQSNPDIAKADIKPSSHFLQFGWKEGRNPSALFNTKFYLSTYKDVESLGVNPLVHYIRTGRAENRAKNKHEHELLEAQRMFDEAYYLKQYPDVKKQGLDPFVHYLTIGCTEGKNPSIVFDTKYYLDRYPDIPRNKLNPLIHYANYGVKEKRLKHPVDAVVHDIAASGLFDEAFYIENADITTTHTCTPLEHYCLWGWKKGFNPSLYFDTNYYLNRSEDVRLAGMNPLHHYVKFGITEGRVPTPNHEYCMNMAHVTSPLLRINPPSPGKIAVVLHLFYTEMADEYIGYLKNIPYPFDLLITTSDVDVPGVEKRFSSHFPSVQVFAVANRGRDIAPFLATIGETVLAYDYVCKIHTKKSPHKLELCDWRQHLLSNLMGSPEAVHAIINHFETNPKTGMIYPVRNQYLENKVQEMTSWGNNFEKAHTILEKLGIESTSTEEFDFPTGSMMWFRPQAILPLIKAGITIHWFEAELAQVDGTFAHVVERLLGLACTRNGYEIKTSYLHHGAFLQPALEQQTIEKALEATASREIQFSVIMPTWNRKNVIQESVDSVLNQVYQEFELIISDDGSEDGTVEYLKELYPEQLASGKIVIIENEHNGVSATRNVGLKRATKNHIAYLDSDNIWRKEYLLMTAYSYTVDPATQSTYAGLCVRDFPVNYHKILNKTFDLAELKKQNFIDLNIYTHHRSLYETCGGFNEQLKRLVDWDMILHHCEAHTPVHIPYVLCDYFLKKEYRNISYTRPLKENLDAVKSGINREPIQRIGYVLADFPAKSQTFVFAEIENMIAKGYDVKVYYSLVPDAPAKLSFSVDAHRVDTPEQLASLLAEHRRQWCHCHFATPTVSEFMYPASLICNVPFSFMPHAVDIFAYSNMKNNKIKEVTHHPNCRGLVVHGDFHENFLIEQGVPAHKILKNAQAIDIPTVKKVGDKYDKKPTKSPLKVVSITRFIEKKGLVYLIEAAKSFTNDELLVEIYGYGPSADSYQKCIADKGITNVILKSSIDTVEERDRVMAEADIFALPCIRAENGDMDGMPTVFFESIAAGTVVLTTPVAGIPDYLTNNVDAIVVKPNSVDAIVAALRAVISNSRSELTTLAKNAQKYVLPRVGTVTTTNAIESLMKPMLDLVIVIAPGVNVKHACQLIEDLEAKTSTQFVLHIVLNGCDNSVWNRIESLVARYNNIEVTTLPEVVGLGVASNKVFRQCKSQHIMYVCCNEGYITRRGWERPIVNYMVNNPQTVIAGNLVASPKWLKGSEFVKQSWFAQFRNQDFAISNPDRAFYHVQGGLFIVRKDFFVENGGFALPHSHMDVEFSYFVESMGYKLGEIPEIVSLSSKTLPPITTYINAKTVAVHPADKLAEQQLITQCVAAKGMYCNITGTFYPTQSDTDALPSGSTAFGRYAFRDLAKSEFVYRGLSAVFFTADKCLVSHTQKLFSTLKVHELSFTKANFKQSFIDSVEEAELIVAENIPCDTLADPNIIESLAKATKHSLALLFSLSPLTDGTMLSSVEVGALAERAGFGSEELLFLDATLGRMAQPLYRWKK